MAVETNCLAPEKFSYWCQYHRNRWVAITKDPKSKVMLTSGQTVDQMIKMKHNFNCTDLHYNTTFLVANCPDPTITNGHIDIMRQSTEGQWSDKDEIKATCNPGYGPEGHHFLFCYNGTWYGLRPTCIGINTEFKEKILREK